MSITDLKNLSPEEIKKFVVELGEKPYRVKQIMSWLYQKRISDIGEMSNLSIKLRDELKKTAVISRFLPEKVLSSQDGTRKYLFKLENGGAVESVLIPGGDRFTLCISTQLGCAFKCRFCYTGRNGLARNLTTAEILNQIDAVLNHVADEAKVTNIVFMGMGEPLANYDNTLKALKIIFHPSGFNFSHRRVTLSTAGLIPQMQRLGKDNPVNLAISLNAADNKTRSFLMPINKTYPLEDLLKACNEYPLSPRKRITFEYILIAGVNDSLEDAQKLVGLLRPVRCKINIIPFNEHPEIGFRRPEPDRINSFIDFLLQHDYTVTVRKSGGEDIMAACGQLGGEIN